MKILITSDWYVPVVNGVVTSVVNLQNELIRLGHDVKILTLSNSYLSYQDQNVYYIGSISAGRIYPNARFKIASARKVVKQLIDWNPDVIHTQCEFSSFFIARKIAKKTGAPIVHTYHTVYEDYTHYFSPSVTLGKTLVAQISKTTLNKVQHVIVPTVKTNKILNRYGVRTPISVIPTGIDLSLFSKKITKEEKESLKNKLNIPLGNKVLVYVGRLGKEKNFEEIIDFLSEIEINNLTFLIVGGGPYRKELEDYASNSGIKDIVVFAGMVPPDKVPTYYQLGDVFVSASKSETQGLTYIECLACGTPALCKHDDCLEGVIINGENGWQYNNFEEFKNNLIHMLEDDSFRTKLGENGKALIFKNFSTRNFAEKVISVYEKVTF